jgi:hypothetical protein
MEEAVNVHSMFAVHCHIEIPTHPLQTERFVRNVPRSRPFVSMAHWTNSCSLLDAPSVNK